MKHTLILISILLLSSFLTSCEKKNGPGTETFEDGGKNGQGTFTWSDGKKYVGEYKEDLMNGQGTISWSNMEKFVGEWKDGKQWNGTYYDKEGNIHSKVVNGKGQK